MAELSLRAKLGGRLGVSIDRELTDRPPHQGHPKSLRAFLLAGYPAVPSALEDPVLAMSGGGAKGSFQLGVIHFLRISGLWENLGFVGICGTSVGAINALGLQPNTQEALEDIENVWLSLRGDPDMFVQADWVRTVLDGEVGGLVGMLLSLAADKESPSFSFRAFRALAERDTFGETLFVLDVLPVIGLVVDFLQARAGERLEDIYRDLVQALELLNDARYAFDLRPTAEKLHRHMEQHWSSQGGLPLRMVAVQLESGAIAWMDEGARLWIPPMVAGEDTDGLTPEPHAVTSGGPGPERIRDGEAPFDTTTPRLMVQGAMASAAIPVFFPPGRFRGTGDRYLGTFVDGGVRDIVPADVIGSVDGVKSVVSVSVSPVHAVDTVAPVQVRMLYQDAPLLDMGLHSSSLMLSEVHRSDLAAIDAQYDAHLSIAPDFAVHDTKEIDPGAIRINAAYGYLRAFDEFKRAAGEVLDGEAFDVHRQTHSIIHNRVQAFWAERAAVRYLTLPDEAVVEWAGRQSSDLASRVEELLEHVSLAVEIPRDQAFPRKDPVLLRMLKGHLVNQAQEIGKFQPSADWSPLAFGLPVGRVVFDGGLLARARTLKRRVAEGVLARLQRFGPESFPVELENKRPVTTWWEDWELHYSRGAFLHVEAYDERQLVVQEVMLLPNDVHAIFPTATGVVAITTTLEDPFAPLVVPDTWRAALEGR